MKITLKDYIENHLMDDVDYAISNVRREGKNTINGIVVRVYHVDLARITEQRLKISSSDLIYKVIDRAELRNIGDVELIPWRYYHNSPDDAPEEISDEEALDLIRRILKAKYRIETIDKSRLAILENKEE